MDKKRYEYYNGLLRASKATDMPTVVIRKRRQSMSSEIAGDELHRDGCRALGSPTANSLAGRQAPKIPLVFEILRKDYNVNNIPRR